MVKISRGISSTILIAALSMSLQSNAAQGDFDGVYNVSLVAVNENVLTKDCFYRGVATLARNAPYVWDRVYAITMSNGKTAHVSFVEVSDNDRSSPHVRYEKSVVRFSDCPNNLLLIYNTLTREFRESR